MLTYQCIICGKETNGIFHTENTLNILCPDCWLLYRQLKRRHPEFSDTKILEIIREHVLGCR